MMELRREEQLKSREQARAHCASETKGGKIEKGRRDRKGVSHAYKLWEICDHAVKVFTEIFITALHRSSSCEFYH